MNDDYRSMLASVGAYLDSFNGTRMFRCPVCSDQRKKKAEKCLSVLVDADGFAFCCHHCGWGGGSGRTRHSVADRPRPQHDDQQGKIKAASRIWRAGIDPRGTVVERYLASRALPLPDDLASEVLRFHPAIQFDGRNVPGMVALLRDIETDNGCGIIRTFLDKEGRKSARRMLGRAGGAAVKLDADANVTEGLCICEGTETGISGMIAGYRPIWAVGSSGGITRFPVLSGVEVLTILTETNDGGANARAVEAVSARWHEAGREVLTVDILVGNDLNDVWREVAP